VIRVIAVDDELPALRRVDKLLQAFGEVEVSGLFDSPRAFLEHALTVPDPIDLVLLDMEMPGLHGLELARRLRSFRPETHIAFLTAYESYARDAFEVEALDYLLKPIAEADVARLLERYAKRADRSDSEEGGSERSLSVRSFGPFAVTTEKGETVRFRNSKGRELLAYLHHHGGKPVGKARILEELWPGGDAERTQVNLHSTVYQLRKDLEACGLQGVVEQAKTAGGSYSLRWPSGIDDDVAFYERELRQFKRTSSLTSVLKAIRLYGDGYLSGSGYGWAAPRQAELEIGYAQLLEAMIGAYVRQERYEIALAPMQKWVQLLPLDEKPHAGMIALLLLLKREKDAREYCELVTEMLEPREEPSILDLTRILADPASFF